MSVPPNRPTAPTAPEAPRGPPTKMEVGRGIRKWYVWEHFLLHLSYDRVRIVCFISELTN